MIAIMSNGLFFNFLFKYDFNNKICDFLNSDAKDNIMDRNIQCH